MILYMLSQDKLIKENLIIITIMLNITNNNFLNIIILTINVNYNNH